MTDRPFGECDAPQPRPYYVIGERDGRLIYGCRCAICARCGHHTGNTTQGHFWSWCQVSQRSEGYHFCCPGNCEYGQDMP